MPKASKKATPNDDLRSEYRFDYTRARPNRFASRYKSDALSIVLDPDVAAVFRSSEAVNELLRGVIRAMPPARKRSPGKRRSSRRP